MATKKVFPFVCGDKVLIRSVTEYQLGEVSAITPDVIVLANASWVASTGRFAEALRTGKLDEAEYTGSWCLVNRGAIVDIWPWNHALPSKTI